MTTKSLWPEKFEVSHDPAPRDVLDAQACDLAAKTDGKLSARIDVGSIGDQVSLDFLIIAQALNGYEHRLFQVLHRVYPPFDATFVWGGTRIDVKTMGQFEIQLARILQSESTVKLVSELLELIARQSGSSPWGKKKKKKKK